ncbi:MAG: SPOR domain-containing protein, partial [Pedobacter sp.]
EQHAEHPNRFGHNPLNEEVVEEEDNKSIWSKVWIAVFALILIAAVIYFIKPEWFGNAPKAHNPTLSPVAADSAKMQKVDSTKVKQDSVAKTDSILKANQIQNKIDTVNAKTSVSNDKKPSAAGQNSMFHVIAVSYATEAAAQQYITKVKKIGLNATIAKMEGRRKKVSIASFSTREEAEKQKNILQKRLKGEGFYVKEIKNNTQP